MKQKDIKACSTAQALGLCSLDKISSYDFGNFESSLGVEGFFADLPSSYGFWFKGSNTLDDWLKVNLAEINWFDSHHEAFFDAYHSVKDRLLPFLKQRQPINKEIVVSGFSSGAAIGSIFATELTQNYDVSLITFGQPRVGGLKDESLSKLKTNLRVFNPLDPVTYIPFGIPHYGEAKRVFWWGNPHSLKSYLTYV